jgi:dUTP pyrophosphatase
MMIKKDINVEIVLNSKAKKLGYPRYATPGSSGVDLMYSGVGETIKPGEIKLVKTGVSMSIPEGFEGQIRPRSGLSLKHGITVLNSPGTIDSDYRGDVGVILINLSEYGFDLKNGMRIAQMVFCPIVRADFEEKGDLEETVRSGGGFGHTGLQ